MLTFWSVADPAGVESDNSVQDRTVSLVPVDIQEGEVALVRVDAHAKDVIVAALLVAMFALS